jgi:ethanolamine kinase
LADWHRVHLPSPKFPTLLPTLEKWFFGANDLYSTGKNAKLVDFQKLRILFDQLILEINGLDLGDKDIVFCHNDLLSANIILDEKENSVSFIDYEYGSYNYRTFDIANHFCEWAGFECDYSNYPNKELQKQWIKIYLIHKNEFLVDLEGQIQKYLFEVEIFKKASHLYWGLWGLLQAAISDIEFNYYEYSMKRLKCLGY